MKTALTLVPIVPVTSVIRVISRAVEDVLTVAIRDLDELQLLLESDLLGLRFILDELGLPLEVDVLLRDRISLLFFLEGLDSFSHGSESGNSIEKLHNHYKMPSTGAF